MPIAKIAITCLLLSWQLVAQAQKPVIAIIIDDLGNKSADEQAINLPGAVACAFLPHTPHVKRLAKLAHANNKEVLLHAPMQSMHEDKKLGPGSLTIDMTESEFVKTIQESLASVPHVQGINNHMGSLLTRHPGHMQWLMQEINRQGDLFFVDSRTTAHSVAHMVATENNIPNLTRDIFLDAENNAAFVEKQFDRLLKIARVHGSALAIAHPYPDTLKVLQKRLKQLDVENVELVPVSTLLKRRQGNDAWQASLSH
ncbi:MAG: divergent polysaccharide deacetylase family protein [Sulfuriflexus sp.]|nr:divergent polysaccharide deacetylase family protein [Sulfuriflexus sp.]